MNTTDLTKDIIDLEYFNSDERCLQRSLWFNHILEQSNSVFLSVARFRKQFPNLDTDLLNHDLGWMDNFSLYCLIANDVGFGKENILVHYFARDPLSMPQLLAEITDRPGDMMAIYNLRGSLTNFSVRRTAAPEFVEGETRTFYPNIGPTTTKSDKGPVVLHRPFIDEIDLLNPDRGDPKVKDAADISELLLLLVRQRGLPALLGQRSR